MPDALIVVDVQNDFCPGGSLPAPEGDLVIPILNQYLVGAASAGIPIFASRDWHPPDTHHFIAYGGIWPPHCVQGTSGADFHADLRLPSSCVIVSKGDNQEDDGYSAFEGRLANGETLESALREHGVTRVYVGGLATDYCVLRTVLDACRAGFMAVYLQDASRAIEAQPGDGARAEESMLAAGAVAGTLEEFHPSSA